MANYNHYKNQIFRVQEIEVGDDTTFIRDLKKDNSITLANHTETIRNPRYKMTFQRNQVVSITAWNGAWKRPEKQPNRPTTKLAEKSMTTVNPKDEGDKEPFEGTISILRRGIKLRLANRYFILGLIGDLEVDCDGRFIY